MKIIIAAFAALVLAGGSAVAGEGNGEPFPNRAAGRFAVPAVAFNDTGSAGYIRTERALPGLEYAGAVLQTGSERPVQTANSLPVDAEVGTVAYAQALSVQRWVMAHEAVRSRVAAR